ncbi:hypothetical protein [Crassaminicella profunda]|uniref:hypothetical protein n=1 Tax=Crassaminicella profunda TaxID=1286698 RepID=UPI001CA71ED3|nr:hypothetical protein [Crassaminicella profunda]QZY54513.1 hypothetical protein K7H06_15925 [Crassaminicella profunda]
MKKMSIMALVVILVLSFTGCSNKEMKLYSAFEKAQEITSMESDTDITFTFNTTGFSQEEQNSMQMVQQMLKDSKISLHQKMLQNEEKTIAKAKVDADITFGGMMMNTQVWVDTDLSGKTPKLVEVIKLPPMVMAAAPEFQNKEYIVYNFNEMMDMNQNKEVDFNKLMNVSKELQPKLTKFLRDYAGQFNPRLEMVEYKGNKSVDGKNVSVYELRLDDRSFKKLVRYAANNFLENEDALKFIKEYMTTVVDMTEAIDTEKETAKEEMDKGFDEFKNNIPQMKENINVFMDAFEDVEVLGENGIVIEYMINEDGYIVNEKGTIDLNIDLAKLEKAFKKVNTNKTNSVPAKNGVFKIGLNFNSKIYNINKEIEIEKPALTIENTLYFSDMMKSAIVQTEQVETVDEGVLEQ